MGGTLLIPKFVNKFIRWDEWETCTTTGLTYIIKNLKGKILLYKKKGNFFKKVINIAENYGQTSKNKILLFNEYTLHPFLVPRKEYACIVISL